MRKATLYGLAAAFMLTACQSDFCRMTGEAHSMADGDTLCLTTDFASNTPFATVIVEHGQFAWDTTVDTAYLCKIFRAGQPQGGTIFIVERGHVHISLEAKADHSRVSGTQLNNEWQSLCDGTAEDSRRISRTVSELTKAGTPPAFIHDRVARLYAQIEQRIADVGQRNKDNVLGRYILSHHKE